MLYPLTVAVCIIGGSLVLLFFFRRLIAYGIGRIKRLSHVYQQEVQASFQEGQVLEQEQETKE
jgi:hypothetical protein